MAYRSVGMAKRIKEDKVISKKTIGERKVLAQNDKKFSIYLTLLNKYKVYFILSIILILALVATMFGINSYKNNIKVISIDDDNYTKSDYMIYLYSAKYNYYGNKVNDIKSSDLDVMYDDESKITVRDYLNEVAVGDIKTASAIKTIARKNNIELSSDDENELNHDKDAFIKKLGGKKEYKKFLHQNNTTDEAYDKYFSLSATRLVVYYDGDDANVYSDNLTNLTSNGVTITFEATPKEYKSTPTA